MTVLQSVAEVPVKSSQKTSSLTLFGKQDKMETDQDGETACRVEQMKWGLDVAFKTKPLANARLETVFEVTDEFISSVVHLCEKKKTFIPLLKYRLVLLFYVA